MIYARYIGIEPTDGATDALAGFEAGTYDVTLRAASGYIAIGGSDVATSGHAFGLTSGQEYTFREIAPGELFLLGMYPDIPQGVSVLAVPSSD